MTQNSNEIDIINLIVITYNFIKRKIKIILIFLLISLIAGILGYLKTKKTYLNTLIVTTHLKKLKSNNVYVTEIQPLYSILHSISENSKNSNFVKDYFNVDPKKISNIQIEILNDKNIIASDLQNIAITVKTNDSSIYNQIEKSIINYCRKNEYLKKLETEQKNLFFIKSMQYKQLLDSFIFNSRKNENSLIFDFTSLLQNNDIQIYSDTSKISSIELVNSFSKYPKIQNRKIVIGFVYSFVSFSLLILILIIIEIIKNETKK